MLDALEVIFSHIESEIGGKTAKAMMLFILAEFRINSVITKEQFVTILSWDCFKID